MFVIEVDRALTPQGWVTPGRLLVEGERILAVGDRRLPIPEGIVHYGFAGTSAVPGFIDLHQHGGGGHDVMEATPEALEAIGTLHAAHGTTAWLPTTLTESPQCIAKALANVAKLRESDRAGMPEILGVHMEGPFLSPQRRGAQNPQYLREPDPALLEHFQQTAQGSVRLLTLAPELPQARALVEKAQQLGILVSIGHTDATYSQTQEALAWGIQHATHFLDAMRPFAHRDPAVVGALLAASEVQLEVIADGVHLHTDTLRLLVNLLGTDRLILVTDAIAACGLSDGPAELGGLPIVVTNGEARLADSGRLAGSTLTLDQAVRRMVEEVGLPLEEAVAMASLHPAETLGIDDRKGRLAPGWDADVVLLDEALDVVATLCRGRWVVVP